MENHLMSIRSELRLVSDRKQAMILRRFFKTGKGEYGEGDSFLGVKVPLQRRICSKYIDLDIKDVQILLKSRIHEERFCALLILVEKYEKGDEAVKKKIFNFYIKNTKKFNGWDLVDLSAPKIMGDFLLDRDKEVLYTLANSKNLWERRIAIVSTLTFIKNEKFDDTIRISEILLKDKEDLIHKAVGWMLREVGKRDVIVEEKFLNDHYKTMPRVMLRYSIEKFSCAKRDFYMQR